MFDSKVHCRRILVILGAALLPAAAVGAAVASDPGLGSSVGNEQANALCNQSRFWTPELARSTVHQGQQSQRTVNTSIRVDVTQDRRGLKVQVCKLEDNEGAPFNTEGAEFNNDVAFR